MTKIEDDATKAAREFLAESWPLEMPMLEEKLATLLRTRESEAVRPLVEALRKLKWAAEENTGHEPSVSVLGRTLSETEALLARYPEEGRS
jgi:hypothetical protein